MRKIWYLKLIFRIIDLRFRCMLVPHEWMTTVFQISLNADAKSMLLFMHHRNVSEGAYPRCWQAAKLICPKIFAANIAWISNDIRCFLFVFLVCICESYIVGSTLLNMRSNDSRIHSYFFFLVQHFVRRSKTVECDERVYQFVNSWFRDPHMRDFGAKTGKNAISVSARRSIVYMHCVCLTPILIRTCSEPKSANRKKDLYFAIVFVRRITFFRLFRIIFKSRSGIFVFNVWSYDRWTRNFEQKQNI